MEDFKSSGGAPIYRKPVGSSHEDAPFPQPNTTPPAGGLQPGTSGPTSQAYTPQSQQSSAWMGANYNTYQPVEESGEKKGQETESRIAEMNPELPMPRKVKEHHRRRLLWWALRYFGVVIVVFVAFLIPILVFMRDAVIWDGDDETIEQKQYRNLILWMFLWLEVTWVGAVLFDLLALGFPYLFRFIARYVNSSHQKYWRILKFMRRPIAFLGTTVIAFSTFSGFINFNDALAVNFNKQPDDFNWDDTIEDVLEQLSLWVCFYFIEKVLIAYISIHFHYRANGPKLAHSKDMHNALITLYEASLYLHPRNSGHFEEEDAIIRNAKGDAHASGRVRVSSYMARLGIDGYKLTSLFGNFISDEPNAHWLRPASSYATIERAIANPSSAAALATRIWMSLVVNGKQSLTADDIAEVLGPFRKEEAKAIFKILDENETGDIQLDEMVGIVAEAGAIRHNIYRQMHDMDHCINTFDWFCLLIIAGVMTFFILVVYVPTIKQIQEILSYLALGLSFALGRTFHHLFTGIVFVFFDHPYDVGDVVSVYNPTSTVSTLCTVKRQSLLYTVFKRQDNNADMQISNERLSMKRIENYTRSGINRQGLSMFVDFRTGFKDIMRLRKELETFLGANARDYVPESLALNVVSLHELNKMELRIAFTHRSNWSDDKLRSQRSNRFHCALVAACRKIPLYKPGGMLPLPGENGMPMYTVQLSTQNELAENVSKEKNRREGLRWDSSKDDNAFASPDGEESLTEADFARLAREKEAEKLKSAKEAEEAAYSAMTKKAAPAGKKSAVSTGFEVGSATGLRMKSNSGADGMQYR